MQTLAAALALALLASAQDHGHAAAPAAPPTAGNSAPANCLRLSTDADWPARAVWDAELPGWEALGATAMGANAGQRHPDVKYEVKRPASVARALAFARKHRVRLSIINSGHDFPARNDAPSGILLDVGGMKGVRVLEEFVPSAKGAEGVDYKTVTNVIKPVAGKQPAVTLGAGMSYTELNRELAKSGLWTIGAAHGDVSIAGGWSQGGGHSWLSMEYGLGVDHALEYKLVTADGNLTVTNAVSNPDLFWALRGGGGGTWGVVYEATFKVHPAPHTLSYNFWLNTTDYDDHKSIFAPAAYFHTMLPHMADIGGFQGYIYVHPNAIAADLIAPNAFANATHMREVLDPILDKMASFPGMNPKTLVKYPPMNRTIPSMFAGNPPKLSGAEGAAWLAKMGVPKASAANIPAMIGKLGKQQSAAAPSPPPAVESSEMVGIQTQGSRRLVRRHGPGEEMRVSPGRMDMDSRLLGDRELKDPKMAEALEKAMPFDLMDGQIRVHLVAGPKVWGADPEGKTSINPMWRRTYAHSISTGAGTPNAQGLRDLAPDTGAYPNEAWIGNPNWKKDFWGPNYAKLSEIKSKWDPDMLFWVTPGINADHMVVSNGRLCRVQGAPPKVENDACPIPDNENKFRYQKERPKFPMRYQGKGLPLIMGTPFAPRGKYTGNAGVAKPAAKGEAMAKVQTMASGKSNAM